MRDTIEELSAYERYIDKTSKKLAAIAIINANQDLSIKEKWSVLERVKERMTDGFTPTQMSEVIHHKVRDYQKHPLEVLSRRLFPAMLNETTTVKQQQDDLTSKEGIRKNGVPWMEKEHWDQLKPDEQDELMRDY